MHPWYSYVYSGQVMVVHIMVYITATVTVVVINIMKLHQNIQQIVNQVYILIIISVFLDLQT